MLGKIKQIICVICLCAFTFGILVYLLSNGEKIVNIMLTSDAEVFEPQVNILSENEKIEIQEDLEIIETIMEFDSKPTDFLEEIFPQLSPDPNRDWAEVIETSIGGGTQVDNFTVNDSSGASVDLEEKLEEDLPFSVELSEEPLVLIYHTHTSEAYMSGYTGYYYLDTDTRTTNNDLNVTSVGEVLKETLEANGISVIHDITVHDSVYTGSYDRSAETVAEYLEKYPSIKITIDVHRDSMTTDSGAKYKPTVSINGTDSAQIMLIAGSDPSGILEYDNWEDNLIFNLKLAQMAETLYPGLMRPVMYCERKYNMDMTNASILIEVGTEVNTISEAKYAGELMGDVIAKVILG
ncbi:MAG: stage II sporulation protein P [Clostridia bacterium]